MAFNKKDNILIFAHGIFKNKYPHFLCFIVYVNLYDKLNMNKISALSPNRKAELHSELAELRVLSVLYLHKLFPSSVVFYI